MAKKIHIHPNQANLFSSEQLYPITELEATRASALACTACALAGGRTQVVFGSGKEDRPDIMFIGEAPGVNEDAKGRPFSGQAGEILRKLLKQIGYDFQDVYLANIVMCRPPNNKKPEMAEIAACASYLVRQIRIVKPRVICLLGQTAAEATFHKTFKGIDGVRNVWYQWDKTPVRCSFHPSILLPKRQPFRMEEALDDLKAVRAKVEQVKLRAHA